MWNFIPCKVGDVVYCHLLLKSFIDVHFLFMLYLQPVLY